MIAIIFLKQFFLQKEERKLQKIGQDIDNQDLSPAFAYPKC